VSESEPNPETKTLTFWGKLTHAWEMFLGVVILLIPLAGALAFWWIFGRDVPLLFNVAVALLLAFFYELLIGRRNASVVQLTLVGFLAVDAVAVKASVGICLLLACAGSIVFWRAKSVFRHDGLVGRLLPGLFQMAASIAGVAGVLWVFSFYLRNVPPQHLLDLGRHLNTAIHVFDVVEKATTSAFILLIAMYLWLQFGPKETVLSSRATQEGSRSKTLVANMWNWATKSSGLRDRLSLILVCVAAFTFIATGPQNSPLQELNSARAKALSDYQDVVWQVELSLRAEVIFEVAQSIYDKVPPSVRASAAVENELNLRAIPAAYYLSGFSGMSTQQLINAQDRGTEWRNSIANQTHGALENERLGVRSVPPAGVSLRDLEGLKEEAQAMSGHEENQSLPWMNGLGPKVVSKFVELEVSSDRIPILRLVGAQMPLVGKLLDIAFDAIDESISEKIDTLAEQIVRDRASGRIQSLNQGLELARVDIVRRFTVPLLSSADLTQIEQEVGTNRKAADAAQERFNADLKMALDQETQKVNHDIMLFKELAPSDTDDLLALLNGPQYADLLPFDPQLRQLRDELNSHDVSMERLRDEVKAYDFAEGKIAEFVYSHPSKAVILDHVLGKDYVRYEEMGSDQRTKELTAELEAHLPDEKSEDEHPSENVLP